MKKCISAILLLMLVACAQVADKGDRHTTVAPLPSGLDVAHLTDATVAARFDVDQIDWQQRIIYLDVYAEDRYDAADISRLAVGDTLAFDGRGVVVDSISTVDDVVRINGGIEFGGAELVADEGGTYRGLMLDDHGTYSPVGNAQLPLAHDLTLTDCGDDYTSPSRTIACDDIKGYLEQDSIDRKFFCLNTTVRISQGKVVNITRRWIP